MKIYKKIPMSYKDQNQLNSNRNPADISQIQTVYSENLDQLKTSMISAECFIPPLKSHPYIA